MLIYLSLQQAVSSPLRFSKPELRAASMEGHSNANKRGGGVEPGTAEEYRYCAVTVLE